jgi:hypothetical protein
MMDSLDADLDRWQDEQDEDYINPADAARERAEYSSRSRRLIASSLGDDDE